MRAAARFLRKREKTKIEPLAVACGCGSRHVAGILSANNPRNMSGELARKIAEFYGLDYGQFLELGTRVLTGDNADQFYLDILREKAVDELVGNTQTLLQGRREATGRFTMPGPTIKDAKGSVIPQAGEIGFSATTGNEGTSISAVQSVQPLERMLDSLSTYKNQEEARPSKKSSVLRQVVNWMDAEFARENLSRELAFMEEMKAKFPSFKAFAEAEEGK